MFNFWPSSLKVYNWTSSLQFFFFYNILFFLLQFLWWTQFVTSSNRNVKSKFCVELSLRTKVMTLPKRDPLQKASPKHWRRFKKSRHLHFHVKDRTHITHKFIFIKFSTKLKCDPKRVTPTLLMEVHIQLKLK